MNKRKIGTKYEIKAAEYLKNNGYIIIDKNYRTRIGEIDIIAKNDNYLCFIEVKYRMENAFISGVYAVDKKKQKTIYNVAKCYLAYKNIDDNIPCRFDVVSIEGDDIILIKNAFPN